MSRVHREVEDKYDVADSGQLPALLAVPGVATVDEGRHELLEATYHDTPDLRLASVGLTLRRRTGGQDEGWHLKLPGTEARVEVHEALGDPDSPVPPRLRDALTGLVGDRTLGPVATLRTDRRVTELRDPGGALLAEVADDRVQATVLLGPGPDSATWREWEVELVEGDVALLADVARLLVAAGARPAQHRSKLARTLGDRVPHPLGHLEPSVDRRDPAALVVRRRLVEQVTELLRGDPQARLDLPDAVHRMRVAVRRLRSALAGYRPLLDRSVTEPLREELRWLAAVLGEPRDAEVLLQRVRALLDEEDADLVDPETAAFVESVLVERHRVSHRRLLSELESGRYRSLLDRLTAVAVDPPLWPPADGQAREVLPGLVRRDWARLEKRAAAAAVSTPDEWESRLHDVRRAAKRVRYAVEPLVPLYGREAERLVRATSRLQTVLGEHHDAVVVQAVLREIARRAGESDVDSFTLGVLYAREEATAGRATGDFERTWARAARPRLRRWLS